MTEQSLQFGFAFTQKNGTQIFQAGIQEVEVAELPDKYTLALVLHQDEQIWVTDWINKPLQGFEWTLGKHSFKLSKNTDPKYKDKARGGYVLMFDDTPYFFHKNMAQIKFGTDGWRGIIAADFTVENVKRVAQGTAEFIKKKYSDHYPIVSEIGL